MEGKKGFSMSLQCKTKKTFKKEISAAFFSSETSKKRRRNEEETEEVIVPITDFEDVRPPASDSRIKKVRKNNNDKMAVDNDYDGKLSENGDNVKYGLTAKKSSSQINKVDKAIEELSIKYLRDRINNKNGSHQPEHALALEDFKDQVQHYPDEKEIDYDSVNMEDYGLNMLKKMGWKPGMVIGRNQDIKLKDSQEPKPRPTHLGLGADILPIKKKT